MTRSLALWLLAAATANVTSASALPVPDADNGGLQLPPGFRALVVADGLGPLRFMAVAENGDLYIKRTRQGIVALHDSKGDGRADVVQNFGEGAGTGIALHRGGLYYSTNREVFRYPLPPGQLVPTAPAENVVTNLPEQREHDAKAFAFDPEGRLYVEVGCPSNSSGQPDRAFGAKGVDPKELFERHGGFWRFNSQGRNQDQMRDGVRYGTGFRHILAVAWNPLARTFFTVQMGRDQLNTVDPQHFTAQQNAELPAEELHELRSDSNFGWPFTYFDPAKKARFLSPEFGGDGTKLAPPGRYEDPLVAFPAHWAPMQMTAYTGSQFPARYRNGLFVAFHGSWNRAPLPQGGYNVCFVPSDATGRPIGTYEVFADNFKGQPVIATPRSARYRPCGLAEGPDGSLYVADSEKGRVWRIIYLPETKTATGEAAPPNPSTGSATGVPLTSIKSSLADPARRAVGAMIYAQNCAGCHQVDGSGVPNLQPALIDDPVVKGDPQVLLRVLLQGPTEVLPVDRPRYTNAMPAFARLSDGQLADLVTFLRHDFGGGAGAVATEAVAAARGLAH